MSGGRRPRLLLVAPLAPARSGNGLAMRAGLFLEALAARFEVVLWVVPVAAGGGAPEPSRFVSDLARRMVIAELEEDPHWRLLTRIRDHRRREEALRAYPRPALCRFATSRPLARLREANGVARFDALVVLRTYLAPFALPLLAPSPAGRRPRAVLDLDDDEPVTRRRLAALHRVRGEEAAAGREEREAEKHEALECRALPAFDRLLVCHDGHGEALRARFPGADVAVVPNAVAVPGRVLPRPPGPELRLLLVGNLGYLPNQDAARELCREVLPRVRAAAAGRPVVARVAGSSPPAAVRALAALDGVEVVADAPDLRPHYAWADLAAVPLRAGGGTRIKLLEAFAHRLPVVATPVAAEGLAVADGVHLLLAGDAERFAGACLRLGEDPALRRRLATAALRLVRERHDRRAVAGSIQRLLADP